VPARQAQLLCHACAARRPPRCAVSAAAAGEKKLRALLNKTEEWNNAEAREALARVCDVAGDASATALAGSAAPEGMLQPAQAALVRAVRRMGLRMQPVARQGGAAGDAPRRAGAAHALALAPRAAAAGRRRRRG
jgi:hypothetical protein